MSRSSTLSCSNPIRKCRTWRSALRKQEISARLSPNSLADQAGTTPLPRPTKLQLSKEPLDHSNSEPASLNDISSPKMHLAWHFHWKAHRMQAEIMRCYPSVNACPPPPKVRAFSHRVLLPLENYALVLLLTWSTSSLNVRSPRQIVRPHINCDRCQTQYNADPEHRR